MKTVDGVRFQIGKDCGSKDYGLDFNTTAHKFNELLSRQRYLIRLHAYMNSFPIVIGALGTLTNHPVFSQFESVRSDLRGKMPNLHQQLLRAKTRHDNALVVQQRVRDIAAEERRADRQTTEEDEFQTAGPSMTTTKMKAARKVLRQYRKARKGEIYKDVDVPFGRLSGSEFLKIGSKPKEEIQQCALELQSVHAELRSKPTEDFSNRKLIVIFRAIREVIEVIETQFEILRSPLLFFEQRHLVMVARWASAVPACGGTYRVTGRKLVQEIMQGNVEVELPSDYQVPTLSEWEEFKRASAKGDDA